MELRRCGDSKLRLSALGVGAWAFGGLIGCRNLIQLEANIAATEEPLFFTLLATRLKPRLILLVNLAGCLVSLAIMLIFSQSVAVLWSGSIGLGFFMSSIFPSTSHCHRPDRTDLCPHAGG